MRSNVVSLIGIISLLFLSGCAPKFNENEPKAWEKSFDQEDQLIVQAFFSDALEDHQSSQKLYDILYKKSHKNEYLFERFKHLYQMKAFDTLLAQINIYLDQAPRHTMLLRYKVAVLSVLKRIEEAKSVAFVLVDITKEAQDYQRVASLYIAQNNYKQAMKYLESAYAKAFDEDILTDLATIMYLKLGDKKGAVSHLESHSRIHGCTVKVCEKLAGFYADMDDTNGQISTYKRLFKVTKDPQYAQAIIKSYAYNQDKYKLITFLEESAFNDELLLRLYMAQRDYQKSIGLSNKLFLQTNKVFYQAQYAIALYESKKSKSLKIIRTVIKNLREVVQKDPDATYLNYLGYLLIEHDVDVNEGIKFVNKALAIEKESGFYMDSLAWGYYKQKECKKALSTIKKAKKLLGREDPEINAHFQLIQECK